MKTSHELQLLDSAPHRCKRAQADDCKPATLLSQCFYRNSKAAQNVYLG